MEDRKEWKTGEKSDIEIRNLSVSFQDGGETVHAMEGVNAYFPRAVSPDSSGRAAAENHFSACPF